MYFLNRYDINDQKVSTVQYSKSKDEIRKFFNQYISNIVKKSEPLISYEYEYNDTYTVCTIVKKTIVIDKGYIFNSISEKRDEVAKISICYSYNGKYYHVGMLHTVTYDNFNVTYDEVVRELKTKFKK